MEPFKRIGFLVALSALFFASYFLWIGPRLQERSYAPGRGKTEKKQLMDFDRAGRLFPAITARVDPSVVFIRTEHAEKVQPAFGQPPIIYRMEGGGTGIVFSKDGYIVTNAHIVGDAQKITVLLFNGREMEARITGLDTLTDIAVVKINADGLTPAAFGDSDSLETGQWVLAVGNPMGLSHSVSFGIVSALGRHSPSVTEMYEDYIQTDAAINPGNSGGPLINLDAEIIGMNTMMLSPSQENSGIGFAIPSNIVKWVARALIENKGMVRSWLGVELQAIDNNLADALGLADLSGALIAGVRPSSPASAAGLKEGDVVLSMDDKKIDTIHGLRNRIARTRPGTKITLEIMRDRKKLKIEAKVEQKK